MLSTQHINMVSKKLLNLGSSCIYPKLAPQPIKEEYLLTGSLELTNEPYAVAKIAALKLCRYYNEQYGTNFISVMPTNLYGPHDNFNLETSHVFPALLRKFHLARLLMDKDYDLIEKDIKRIPLGFNLSNTAVGKDKEIIVNLLKKVNIAEDHVKIWGAGESYREFMHVDDLADASLFFMEDYGYEELGELVNIGTGVDIKISDLAALVKKITGYEGEIKYDLSMPEGTPRKLLDISKAGRLGWKAKINLEEGLKKTYDWYCMGS